MHDIYRGFLFIWGALLALISLGIVFMVSLATIRYLADQDYKKNELKRRDNGNRVNRTGG